MKLKVRPHPITEFPLMVTEEEGKIFSDDFVAETLAWARERGLDLRVVRGWRGDPFGFAFSSEAEVDFFMLGRNQFTE